MNSTDDKPKLQQTALAKLRAMWKRNPQKVRRLLQLQAKKKAASEQD